MISNSNFKTDFHYIRLPGVTKLITPNIKIVCWCSCSLEKIITHVHKISLWDSGVEWERRSLPTSSVPAVLLLAKSYNPDPHGEHQLSFWYWRRRLWEELEYKLKQGFLVLLSLPCNVYWAANASWKKSKINLKIRCDRIPSKACIIVTSVCQQEFIPLDSLGLRLADYRSWDFFTSITAWANSL